MKEIWEIDPAKHKPGHVTHTMGWPLGKNAGGGSFVYHLENNQVYVGFVVHLNYRNPTCRPTRIPAVQASPDDGEDLLKGAKRVAYGARAITEGGWQSMPKAVAPGAAVLGCGRRAGERAAHQGQPQRHAVGDRRRRRQRRRHQARTVGDDLTAYDAEVHEAVRSASDLKPVRNVKPIWSNWGISAAWSSAGSTCGSAA